MTNSENVMERAKGKVELVQTLLSSILDDVSNCAKDGDDLMIGIDFAERIVKIALPILEDIQWEM